MKSQRKRTGKGREERDEFLGLTDKVRLYAMENSAKAYTALGVVGAVIVLTVVVSIMMAQSRENTKALQAEALAYYDIEKPGPGDKPMGPTERYAKARELFGKIASEKSGSPAAEVATYFGANADHELGELDKAVETYRKLMSDPSTDPVLYTASGLRLAVALKEKGDIQGAIGVYRQMEEKGLMKGEAHFLAGQLYEDTGNKEQAILEYTVVKKDFPKTPSHPEALMKLGRLQPQEVQAQPAATMPEAAPAAMAVPVKK